MSDAVFAIWLVVFSALFGALGVVIMKALLSFRPFDYWRVIYWHIVLFPLIMFMVIVGRSLDRGEFPDISLSFILWFAGLIAFVIAFNGWGLRRFSEAYARRERQKAEQQLQRESREEA